MIVKKGILRACIGSGVKWCNLAYHSLTHYSYSQSCLRRIQDTLPLFDVLRLTGEFSGLGGGGGGPRASEGGEGGEGGRAAHLSTEGG